ncbi:tether containing UBX domain for GLUT4-like [Dreissena polymorpha]|uniref:tether containing UBX domain for GLUT4-like n=1 Tax=Dreissena polymorpha TaxID=45954 RepID=UPI002263F0A7|nr:tether containing UBX domain for GLUT4-like [Dreissena polymorpha]
MASLQVLCPNGRRQNVKITPNTKLLQVLEDVCQKQKFLPIEDYKLVHGRNTVDLTLSVRYSNLPNNAKLELIKCEKSRAETAVIIALQLETGDRLQHEFHPSTSLWHILEHWEAQDDGKHAGKLTKVDSTVSPSVHPVCIYMREEVTGEMMLRETQLRTLGLTGGKAVLRLLHRPIEDALLDEIKTKIEKDKQRKARMGQAESVHPVASTESEVTNSVNAQSKPESANTNTQVAPEIAVGCESELVQKAKREEFSNDLDEPMDVEQAAGGVELTMETEEVVSSSSDVSMQQTVPDERSERQNAVNQLRDIPGLQVFTPDDFHDLSPEQQQVARQMAQSFLSSMPPTSGLVQQQEAVAKKKPKQHQQQAPFADFKFPEETKGKNVYTNEYSTVQKDDFKPCDRQTMVFNFEETVRLTDPTESNQDVPDEFFELTERDIRSLMSEKQRQLHELEDQPLMTSAMRKAHLEELYGKYERVVIRVQFHDKLVLQGVFRPRETIFAVQKFVKDHLEDKSLQFYLYTSPPKSVLKDNTKTLIEAKLIPAALIYFGSEDQKEHYLSDALLSETSSKLQADILVAECLGATNSEDQSSSDMKTYTGKGKQAAKSQKINTESSSSSSAAAAGTSSSAPSSSNQSDKHVPKWFKVGHKK